MATSDKDEILTTGAAAALLGVAVSTAQQWIESGVIPSWKTPGGHRRVYLSAVQHLLGTPAGEVAPAAPAAPGAPVLPHCEEFLPAVSPKYPVAENEADRLRAMQATGLFDTPPEPEFDRLTWLATQVTDAPMALISLLSARRQWFKSRVGVDVPDTPRDWAFCSHAVLEADLFVVEDALADTRFQNNPLVTGAPYIRFYAGCPLLDSDGFPLGTLCILDREPRKLRAHEVRAMLELSALASEEIQRRGTR
ncbi:GAF domain-containing protein [Massilia sp. CF038]|uniref:GAF domain-containing protein n=1 Tax=Massilia sp. CF038 TaxID=1881045 RepID=UPI00091B1DAF|nr:GAF domain-containing protein [Massilia sp. CF038]SHH00741.1 DNA binding domain-containing protein, excisionase family [Massilia sp. CF038]